MKISWTDKNGHRHNMTVDTPITIASEHGRPGREGNKISEFQIKEEKAYDKEEGQYIYCGSIRMTPQDSLHNNLAITPDRESIIISIK